MKKTITRCGHFDIPARLATEEDSLPPLAPELTPPRLQGLSVCASGTLCGKTRSKVIPNAGT